MPRSQVGFFRYLSYLAFLLLVLVCTLAWEREAWAFGCDAPRFTCGPGASPACCNENETCCTNHCCAVGLYCRTSDSSCQSPQGNGGQCTGGDECSSGFCADGVCCQSACNGLCQQCGAGGTCQNVADGVNTGECTDQGASTCGTDGKCNGAGGCQKYPAGASCGATTCSMGSQNGLSCDGFGTCKASNVTACTPYICGASACATTCTADSGCIASYYCRADHTCQPDQANGAVCTSTTQCQSGNCVDGVCCDSVCNGSCQACSATKKGTGADGTCGNIIAGADPDNECPADSTMTCQRDGSCNGSGACELYKNGTGCGNTTCSSGTLTGFTCNGLGTCNAATTSGCSPYVCANANACANTCTNDSGCVAADYCRTSDSTCQPDQANGATCSSGSQCTSGNCVDGFCCDSPCNGTCQTCTAAKKASGANGVCGAIKVATDPDFECPDDGASTCQRDGVCDGVGACQIYPSGTACGSTTCASGSQTGFACNGNGSCQAAQMTVCAPYVCQSGACGATCGSDVDCVAAAFCDATGHCAPDQANGATCASPQQCVNGQCVDGVCCDQPCTGACKACSAAKKGHGADGVCENVSQGADPDNDCTADAPSTCQKTGSCDGAGACALYGIGTQCGAAVCTASTLTGQQCNGLGACVDGQTSKCDPFVCSGSSCSQTCGDDNGCVPTAFCAAGECTPKVALGAVCSAAHECSSGFCVEGVCCNTLCNGTCQACKAENKVSGADTGTCGFANAGIDPHSDCPDDGALSCKRDGTCDGAGACRTYVAGTACGTTQCVGNDQTGFACDGAGVCQSNTTTACMLRACQSGACTPTCAVDEDCASNAYCQLATGTCVAKDEVGHSCDKASTCKSGFCVDGLCCNEACGGQCQACDVPTAPGMCSPVVGPTHGVRDKCPVATGGDVCSARACDGAKSTGSCVGYVGAEVACRDETCTSGVETFSATCDGAGQCGAQGPAMTKVCQPYVCQGKACGAAPCASDDDCAPDFRCDASKHDCVARNVATCRDHIVTAANGKDMTDCSPYRCVASGTCKVSCASVDDCAAGFVCLNDHTCAPLSGSGSANGGCGCEEVGQTPQSWAGMIFGAMLAAASLARARRRNVR